MASDRAHGNSDEMTVATMPPGEAGGDPASAATAGTAEPANNRVALPDGYVLHEYSIEAELGAGGCGITYLARDNLLQCQVAIKEYLPSDLAIRTAEQAVVPRSSSDTGGYNYGLTRFLSEARVLASFRHPNIVRVSRFFEANGTAYMVMDYERGQSLRAWKKAHGPADEEQLRSMFARLLDGIEMVHKGGIVHRDIKPGNIYVRDSDGSLVLLDFGAARQSGDASTRSLISLITPGYAPFEQYHARGAQGPWTDLYALGGVLYWLVTGKKPVEAPSRVKDDCLPPATQAAAGRYSTGFLWMIDWAMAVDERERPQNVAEFRPVFLGEKPAPEGRGRASAPIPGSDGDAVLPDAVPPTPTFAPSPRAAAPARTGLPLPAIVAGMLVVAGIAVFFALPRSPSPPVADPPQTAMASAPVPASPAPEMETAAPAVEEASPPEQKKPPQSRQKAQQEFSCGDLPFGLRIACGLEGKEVIRKCAPDLKKWNHDLPGCKRQASTNNQ